MLTVEELKTSHNVDDDDLIYFKVHYYTTTPVSNISSLSPQDKEKLKNEIIIKIEETDQVFVLWLFPDKVSSIFTDFFDVLDREAVLYNVHEKLLTLGELIADGVDSDWRDTFNKYNNCLMKSGNYHKFLNWNSLIFRYSSSDNEVFSLIRQKGYKDKNTVSFNSKTKQTENYKQLLSIITNNLSTLETQILTELGLQIT